MRFRTLTIAGLALLAMTAFSMQLVADEEGLAQRRARLEQMTDIQKTRLLQKKRRFDELDDVDQDRYRSLHQELVHHKDYEHLHATLQRYSDWLKALDPVKRAALLDLPANERLARIKELMDAEATERFRLMVSEVHKSKELLSPKDKGVICEWTDKFMRDHQDEILATVREDRFPVKKKDFDPDKHIHFLKFWYFRQPFRGPPPGFDTESGPPPGPFPGTERGPGPGEGERPNGRSSAADSFDALPKPLREEEDDLLAKMSPLAKKVIEKATSEEERSQIIQNWMRAAFWSGFRPSLEDLDRFVRESLSKEERERLESMPRDRMYHELRKLHSYKWRRRGMGRGMQHGGGGFGGPGGSSGRDGGNKGSGGGRGRRGGPIGNKERGPSGGRGDSRPDQKGNPPGERGEKRGSDDS